MKPIFPIAAAWLALQSVTTLAAVAPPSASIPAPASEAPALTPDQAERLLLRDMAIVARCDAGKSAFFLGRYYGEALDCMIAVGNGAAVRYPVHGGRIERVGEKLSARFEIPESFRLAVDGAQGRLLYAADAKKNTKASCRFVAQ